MSVYLSEFTNVDTVCDAFSLLNPLEGMKGDTMHKRLVVAELATACVSSVLAIITIAWPDWIERVFGANPDHGSGLFEVLLTGLLIGAAITSSLTARAELRRGANAKLGDAR